MRLYVPIYILKIPDNALKDFRKNGTYVTLKNPNILVTTKFKLNRLCLSDLLSQNLNLQIITCIFKVPNQIFGKKMLGLFTCIMHNIFPITKLYQKT